MKSAEKKIFHKWPILRVRKRKRKNLVPAEGHGACRRGLKSRRGSSAVMLTGLFLSMILAAGTIGEAASRRAAVSVAECILETAGRSVLAGYDRALKERYALFGYEYDEEELQRVLRAASEESLASFPLTECSIENIVTEKSAYCLGDTEILKEQIEDVMKYRILADAVDSVADRFRYVREAADDMSDRQKQKQRLEEAKEEQRRLSSSEEENGSENGEENGLAEADRVHGTLTGLKDRIDGNAESGTAEEENAILRNRSISDALPSVLAGYEENTAFSGIFSAVSKFPDLADSEEIMSEVRLDSYINSFFSARTDEKAEDSFFRNEIEYILYGSFSDEENAKKAAKSIYALRTALNMAYIYSNQTMLSQTLTLAESLTPGPFAPLTQLLIITAWSALEAYNDLQNLKEANRIPFVKSESSWKVDLESVASGEFDGGMIENDSDTGMSYRSYLMILLLTEDNETKLLRIMDLIQINLKGSSRGDFVFENMFCGFKATVEIKKKSLYAGIGSGRTSVRISHTY